MLEGFKPINLTIGPAYLSVTENGITFNKTSIIKLNSPSHVLLLLNEDAKILAVQVCEPGEKNATPFYKEKKSGLISVRWNNRDFLNTLESLMGWNLKTYKYRVLGDYLQDENAMLFDMKKASQISDEFQSI